MNDFTGYKREILNDGFTIIKSIYDPAEIDSIVSAINNADQSNAAFRKTAGLFAIRRFLIEIPQLKELIFNDRLKTIIDNLLGTDYFIVKSIYFDKPGNSNWLVAWHQDLTISVAQRADVTDYTNWTIKLDQFAVQPPLDMLQNNYTIRIHLDDTDENNGALKVIPGSHLKNICRTEKADLQRKTTCKVKAGGIMIMRPLLLHASDRTTVNSKRRVIHIEFSKSVLPEQINWAEKAFY